MAVETVPQLLLHAAREFDKPNAFIYKDRGSYVAVSCREVLSRVHNIALSLNALDCGDGDRIAILSETRLEWAIADLAILGAGCVDVPIYSTMPATQIEYILRDSRARAVFVSGAAQLEKVLSMRHDLPDLEHIFTFDSGSSVPGVLSLEALSERGASLPNPPSFEEMAAAIEPTDVASIIYTSGTSGEPKGAVLTHGNFVSNTIAAASVFELGPADTCLSFLPLSHAFERTAGYYTMLYRGVSIAYAESIDTVPQNMIEVKPTVMCSVPRLYEKMYARIMQTVTSGPLLKKYLFFWALGVGRKQVAAGLSGRVPWGLSVRSAIANKLVFSRLRERTGGRIRFFVSGGAPLAREIAEFFYAAGLPILEGYGLTETSPVVAANTFAAFRFGTVGKPFPGVEVRVAEDGEILVRGPNVMQGYYGNPGATALAIVDGWFHTGDIGAIDEDGFLSILDRKKDIIVTSGGKKIAPQPIENAIKSSKYIAQAVLVGNGRNFVSAIIVPNFDNLRRFARAVKIPFADIQSLLSNPIVRAKIEREIERKSAGLARFELIKKFILLDQDFSIEMNELTPTLKVKRAAIEKKYRRQIDALYEEGPP
jgi:long-chain acyl-CoA synthetase